MSDVSNITPSDSLYEGCRVDQQGNTVIAQQGIPSTIIFTMRNPDGTPMDLSRWFVKKCMTMPEGFIPLPDVASGEVFPPDAWVPLVEPDNPVCPEPTEPLNP